MYSFSLSRTAGHPSCAFLATLINSEVDRFFNRFVKNCAQSLAATFIRLFNYILANPTYGGG